jgi:transposase-like protein
MMIFFVARVTQFNYYHLPMTDVNNKTRMRQDQSFRLAAKRKLLDIDLSVADLARRMNVSRTAVSVSINHHTMYRTMKTRIAKELGLK